MSLYLQGSCLLNYDAIWNGYVTNVSEEVSVSIFRAVHRCFSGSRIEEGCPSSHINAMWTGLTTSENTLQWTLHNIQRCVCNLSLLLDHTSRNTLVLSFVSVKLLYE
jgi:hypothetical protein